MGIRSTIKFILVDSNACNNPLVNIYQQYDGHIEGKGHELAKFLLSKEIINGIPLNKLGKQNYANGFGCLVSQYIKEFKKEVGGLYLTSLDAEEEYHYEIYFYNEKYLKYEFDIDRLIKIIVYCCSEKIFEGTPTELLNFRESCDEESDLQSKLDQVKAEKIKLNKTIDEMAEALDRYDRGNIKYDFERVFEEHPTLSYKECIKLYFIKKVEEQEL